VIIAALKWSFIISHLDLSINWFWLSHILWVRSYLVVIGWNLIRKGMMCHTTSVCYIFHCLRVSCIMSYGATVLDGTEITCSWLFKLWWRHWGRMLRFFCNFSLHIFTGYQISVALTIAIGLIEVFCTTIVVPIIKNWVSFSIVYTVLSVSVIQLNFTATWSGQRVDATALTRINRVMHRASLKR
jgi:hypothetical protein